MTTLRKRGDGTPGRPNEKKSIWSFLLSIENFTGNAFCAFAILCLTFAGCADLKVQKPTKDSTPPALVWNVFNHESREQKEYVDSFLKLTVKRGQHYRIILKAKDPEGVKSIQIGPEKSWTCGPADENIATQGTPDFSPLKDDLEPDSDGKVLTSTFLIYELNFTMECLEQGKFTGGNARLTGLASNYFDATTKKVIVFGVTP